MNQTPPDTLTVIDAGGGPDRGQINPPGTGTFGFVLLLISLAVLFFSTMLGYAYVRWNAPEWPPPGMPPLPRTLWLSTLLIIVCSVTVQHAVRAVRRDDSGGLRASLVATWILGAFFLVLQTMNYMSLASANLTAKTNLYGFTFYMLTFLHAVHVIGGLIPLAIVTRRAFEGRYSSFYHPGVRYQAMYWHFLDLIWIFIFVVLMLGS
ncbi:MAG: cytochrome c oxidase subunit 3 [Candidatus Eisenbacteria bacterium]